MGLSIKGEAAFDWKGVQQAKDKVVSGLTDGIEFLFKKNKVEYLKGEGKLLGAGKIEVSSQEGKKTIEAENVILATGSDIYCPKGFSIDEKVFISSTGALSLPKVPQSMIVIGAGVIGLEMASVYSRLGSKVTVISNNQKILPKSDEMQSKELLKSLQKQGI